MAASSSVLGLAGRGMAPLLANNVVVGGGHTAGTILAGLARSAPGKVLVISKENSWASTFPRHHQLGQTRASLMFDKSSIEPYYLKQRMTAEEFMRQQADHQFKAVEHLPDDADCLETDLRSVIRKGKQLLLTCGDGQQVLTDRLFLATGVGPERTLSASGIHFENEVPGKRLVHHEVTTALQSMQEQPLYWKGKRVTVYGGGPTAAWIAEVAMSHPLKDILWISRDGFAGANPAGRNSETLLLTEGHRIEAGIKSVRYIGGGATPPEEGGLLLTLDKLNAHWTRRTDIIISAVGSDPMAPTGVKSVLGALYNELQPHVGRQKGVYASLDDGSLFVVSTALTGSAEVRSLIESATYPVLNPENHVIAGLAVSNLSAEDAVDAATKTL